MRRAVLNAKEDGGTVLSSSHAETINLTYVRNLRLQGVHKVSGGSILVLPAMRPALYVRPPLPSPGHVTSQ